MGKTLVLGSTQDYTDQTADTFPQGGGQHKAREYVWKTLLTFPSM